MNDILKKISAIGIVPVVKIDDAKDAVPLAEALCNGGLACAEITFRTDAAEAAIKAISEAYPEMLVGAGTVLTTEQVDRAVKAGAKFIVSPGLNPKVVKYCVDNGIPVVPGCANPSNIEQAIELGLDVVKFFPAEAAGGIAMIKAMAAPYTNIKFMPTGGINSKNLNEYLDFSKIIACGGSWMVNNALIDAGEFDKIRDLTHEAVEIMLGFELAHVGINAENEDEALKAAKMFESLFGFKNIPHKGCIFADKYFEIMKTPFVGKHGHLAIKTNNVSRAVNYLESQGFEFNHDTEKFNAKGEMSVIYLKDEICGFAIHLLQK
ncbi:MAG: bifunctional 4-hydroxy-2-oxoglutarate aldolase/2-dehydro-3-deoxy-phosphogluconate aldolase [Bacillota bacterium]|nr:bifunctional 4-hydroxy-2-oxoglutarate aldolase/2-dehydro-3-deoxy-phosphogluconate aldolase [Bacillota bacterium]